MEAYLGNGVGRPMKPPAKKKDLKKRKRVATEGVKEKTKPRLVEEPEKRIRKKREPTDAHKDPVKANKYAKLEEFGANEPFVVLKEDGGLLKCMPCGGKLINFKRKADVRQHFEGARSKKKGKVEKLTHAENVEAARRLHVNANALQEAVAQNNKHIWELYHKNAKGSTLPSTVLASRTQVLEDMYVLSIATGKLDKPRLLNLIQQPHENLGGKDGVRAQFPVVQRLLKERIVAALKDRLVSIFFDASKVNFLLEAAMCRFLNDDLMPTQLCFGVSAVPKSVDAASLQVLLRRHLTEAGIEMKNVAVQYLTAARPTRRQ
jgi:hypothetical protein